MSDNTLSQDTVTDTPLSRRGLLRLGGAAVALGAVAAACSDVAADKKPARIGSVPPVPTLPEAVISDGVIFRTATSMHYSIIDGHEASKKLGSLTPDQTKLIDSYIEGNKQAITDMQAWTRKAGSAEWTCANPRFDRVSLTQMIDHITGRPRKGTEEADIPPSDDPNRDCMAMSCALENLGAAMQQSFVQTLSQPQYREACINQGQLAARRAARQSLAINPNNLISPAAVQAANPDVTTTTTIAATTTTQNIAQPESGPTTTAAPVITNPQQWYAIPSQFGSLSAVQLSIGAPSAAGTQFTMNLDTPSLNSYIYNYMIEC